jgi:hypothetical protein
MMNRYAFARLVGLCGSCNGYFNFLSIFSEISILTYRMAALFVRWLILVYFIQGVNFTITSEA